MEEQEVYQRLTKLETQMIEKWESHQAHSNEKWGEVKDMLNKIFKRLDVLPCKTMLERSKWMALSIKILWGVLILGGIVKGASLLNGH